MGRDAGDSQYDTFILDYSRARPESVRRLRPVAIRDSTPHSISGGGLLSN